MRVAKIAPKASLNPGLSSSKMSLQFSLKNKFVESVRALLPLNKPSKLTLQLQKVKLGSEQQSTRMWTHFPASNENFVFSISMNFFPCFSTCFTKNFMTPSTVSEI